MTLIYDVFPKLRTLKKLARWLSKKSCLRRRFDKQHSKRAQPLLKSERQHLYHIDWSLWRKLNWKKSLLVICKILRLFVNRLTANDKYFLFNRDNWTQLIQIQLSQKEKTFSQSFREYLKSTSNFEHFEKKRRPSYLMYFRYYGLRKT